ncbi:MAG: colanic acid biosynthesis acetyltransferase WcaF [Candidatus Omnitrophica bacterium]|nr:colanic acid biosynthesis acetyltransferase WcaF [Candidatus Omnitrophota bacterium]
MKKVLLSNFKKSKDIKRNLLVEFLWEVCNILFFQNRFCISNRLKVFILRFFGAKVGHGAIFSHNVKIKYPWCLSVGDHCWFGADLWLDNIVPIEIGNHVAFAQGAFLTTGNHDWTKQDFPFNGKPIVIEDGVWIGARAIVGPGVRLGTHSVLTAGCVVTKDTGPYGIYAGNPAIFRKKRVII